jgi:hypothetical protein
MRRNKFSASSRLRDLNRSADEHSERVQANIALNDSMILPYDANLCRMEFFGKDSGSLSQNKQLALIYPGPLLRGALMPAQIKRTVDQAHMAIGLWKIAQHTPG